MKLLYVGLHTEDFEWSEDLKTSMIYCSNAFEALQILSSGKDIRAIICDHNLPGNNGIYFYKELKEHNKFSKLPFILMVEEHNQNIYKQAHSIGIDDYFVFNATATEKILLRSKQLARRENNAVSNNSLEVPATYKFPLSKRIFDIAVASIILLLLSPLLLLTILAIRLESKGKVYYVAKRVGRKTFDFYKLRSMRIGADRELQDLAKKMNQYNKQENLLTMEMNTSCPRCSKLPLGEYCSPIKYEGIDKICDFMFNIQKKNIQNSNSSFIKIKDDPRITRIGKFIRNTSIDELPQLINVIKGDMSLVGNRPLPVYEAELLTQDQLSKRFLAPAGITGLWQVELRGKGGAMSEEERIALDNKYADYFIKKNYSFWYDMGILLRTIPALFQKSTV